MVHKDNPDKHQYDWNGITTHGGANIDDLMKPSQSERFDIQKQILDYIDANDITEFSDLIDNLRRQQNDDQLFILLNYSTMSINAHIKSRRHKKDLQDKIDEKEARKISKVNNNGEPAREVSREELNEQFEKKHRRAKK
jgi:hypothetical protein